MDPAQSKDLGSSAVDTPAARKYRLFKGLLDRNREALGAMADLEQAYYGGRVTSVTGLRARYDRLARSAHELVLYFHFPKAIAKGSAVADGALAVRVRPMGGVIDQAGGLAFGVRNMGNY